MMGSMAECIFLTTESCTGNLSRWRCSEKLHSFFLFQYFLISRKQRFCYKFFLHFVQIKSCRSFFTLGVRKIFAVLSFSRYVQNILLQVILKPVRSKWAVCSVLGNESASWVNESLSIINAMFGHCLILL